MIFFIEKIKVTMNHRNHHVIDTGNDDFIERETQQIFRGEEEKW